METIRGRMSLHLDIIDLEARLKNYNRILLDLGTGDGRYVRTQALRHPDWFVVGMDACRENLREHSRAKMPNMLFVIACAQRLPGEFNGLFSHITINFPWGSLLEDLMTSGPNLMDDLLSISRPDTQIEIHLNGGALTEAGATLETGSEIIYKNLHRHGWKLKEPRALEHGALMKIPTTWAKRLAYGRDPRAMNLTGRRA